MTPEQQAVLALHRSPQRFIKQRTAQVNQIRETPCAEYYSQNHETDSRVNIASADRIRILPERSVLPSDTGLTGRLCWVLKSWNHYA